MARMTVKTLAAALGVSPATISNAYNRPDQLSPQLRERILTTAEELGYPGPDAAGRTLRRVGRMQSEYFSPSGCRTRSLIRSPSSS